MGDRKTFINLMGFVLLILLVVSCSQATQPQETPVPSVFVVRGDWTKYEEKIMETF